MTITPIPGEALMLRVSSQSGGEDHRVDLSEHFGNGACDCTRFRIVCTRRIKAGEPMWTERTACAHVRACWTWWRQRSLFVAASHVHLMSTFEVTPKDVLEAALDPLFSPSQTQHAAGMNAVAVACAPSEPMGKLKGRTISR
jgi:hypothetical protein